jgi:hypothetical protein
VVGRFAAAPVGPLIGVIGAICGWIGQASSRSSAMATVTDRQGSRRIVGFALAGSAGVLMLVAALVYKGVFGIAEQSRAIVAGAMGIAAALDLVMAIYFILSDQS